MSWARPGRWPTTGTPAGAGGDGSGGLGDDRLVLALHLDRLLRGQHEAAAERPFAVLEVHPVRGALLDHLAGLVGRDGPALGGLPDHEAAPRLLAALPRRAAVGAAVLANVAAALRAGGDRLARPGRRVQAGAAIGDPLHPCALGQNHPLPPRR